MDGRKFVRDLADLFERIGVAHCVVALVLCPGFFPALHPQARACVASNCLLLSGAPTHCMADPLPAGKRAPKHPLTLSLQALCYLHQVSASEIPLPLAFLRLGVIA